MTDAAPPSKADRGPVLKTLLLTDLADSTRLLERLGDRKASTLFARLDRRLRELLTLHAGLEVDKTDGFLLLFDRPGPAVEFALAYHAAVADVANESGHRLGARIGIHLGEVILRSNPAEDVARGAKPLEVEGLAKPMAARLMSLAGPGQTLLTRTCFDLGRRAAVGYEAGAERRWLAHGRYLFQGIEEPVEVFEVGLEGTAPLRPPPSTAKAVRLAGDDTITGWRPAPGQAIPRRHGWDLETKLGEGPSGEVWVAKRRKIGDRRVFKFCYRSEELDGLKREVAVFRVLKESLGARHDFARLLDWSFDEPPFFIELQYFQAGDLPTWAESCGGLSRIALETRLELLAQAAEALAAAHSVGVLHKNLKPSNILIEIDREGRPGARLTDFGYAQVTDRAGLREKGISFTNLEASLGAAEISPDADALRYAAPEVLEKRPATLQADLYSFGVILYQLVAADFGRALAPGWERQIDDELLREEIAGLVDGAPEGRPADARRLAENLRSLEERRARRAAERQARLKAERAARRWKILGPVALALALFGAAMTWQVVQVRESRRQAMRYLEWARQAVDGMLTEVATETLADLPGVQEIRERLLEKARIFSEGLQRERPTDPALRLEAALAARRLGDIYRAGNEREKAETEYRSAIARLDVLSRDAPGSPEILRQLALAYDALGRLLTPYEGSRDAALDALDRARDLLAESPQRASDDPARRSRLARVLNNRALLLEGLGRPGEAEADYRRAAAELEELLSEAAGPAAERDAARLDLARVENNLATLIAGAGRPREAEPHFQRAMGLYESLVADHPGKRDYQQELAQLYANLAYDLSFEGAPDVAGRLSRRAVQLFRSAAAPTPAIGMLLANAHFVRASVLRTTGLERRDEGLPGPAREAFAEAEAAYEESIAVYALIESIFPDFARQRRDFQERHAISLLDLAILRLDGGPAGDTAAPLARAAALHEPLLEGLDPEERSGLCGDYAWAAGRLGARGRGAAPGLEPLRRLLRRCTESELPEPPSRATDNS